ncbi:hypothetical protein pEaSNUABM8_00142 [Erwinia phage pEa_SNUABM_8]|nr:hypothetical protein pEaSNUABM8_00142 [Erwinia phage pEa_SNUABM_8]QVW54894.1 hypothetical protein pEaSNUABM4_00141 [Erwinia phage pEa_SNUABM_4]
MTLIELIQWVIMVLAGYFLIQCVRGSVKDLIKGDLMGMFVELVFALIAWNVHKWAFIELAPLQTLF